MPQSHLREALADHTSLGSHPQAELLLEVASGDTHVSSAGFPYISDRSFRLFIERIPHLFQDGQRILTWLADLEAVLAGIKGIPQEEMESIGRAIKVLRIVVFTAGITAPPDLWLLRQILSTHKRLGTLDWLLAGHAVDPEVFAHEHGLDLKLLKADIHFIHSRGYLRKGDDNFLIPDNPAVVDVLHSVQALDASYQINLVRVIRGFLSGDAHSPDDEAFLRSWLTIDVQKCPTNSWIANCYQIELGYRVLPIVLSLRMMDVIEKLDQGEVLAQHIPRMLPGMQDILDHAGLARDGVVSELGARVFSRGPGPFGIIGAYHPYLNNHDALLRAEKGGAWVHRGENVAASQDANRKTFQIANDRLDAFCERFNFRYTVFVEHAVGQGEATKQRLARSGEDTIRYFGADLEDDAIDQAIEQQRQGFLPRNMQFIRSADIGEPARVVDFLREQGLADEPTVMMVGNGFHEIREQTNEKMIEVFKRYQEAGFVLIFTEESALHDEALLQTAWNTYHAGFRYVHEISGQGLRPARERGEYSERWSWPKCATLAGYITMVKFCYRGRTIYPHKRPEHKNPSISETYFCIPYKLAAKLGVKTDKV